MLVRRYLPLAGFVLLLFAIFLNIRANGLSLGKRHKHHRRSSSPSKIHPTGTVPLSISCDSPASAADLLRSWATPGGAPVCDGATRVQTAQWLGLSYLTSSLAALISAATCENLDQNIYPIALCLGGTIPPNPVATVQSHADSLARWRRRVSAAEPADLDHLAALPSFNESVIQAAWRYGLRGEHVAGAVEAAAGQACVIPDTSGPFWSHFNPVWHPQGTSDRCDAADGSFIATWSEEDERVRFACPPDHPRAAIEVGNEAGAKPKFRRSNLQRVYLPGGVSEPVTAEYVRALCVAEDDDESVLLRLLMRNRPIPSVFKAALPATTERTPDGPLSVAIIIVDSLSTQQAMRQLPRTMAFLADPPDHDSFPLLGYNVVGRGTYNNLGKFYAGVPTFDEGEADRRFLWSAYRDAGFVTSYLMDDGYAVFPSRKYYETHFRPLEGFRAMGGAGAAKNVHKVQDEKVLEERSRLCFGQDDINDIDLNYTAEFHANHLGKRAFSITHMISCHESTMRLAERLDVPLASFFDRTTLAGTLRDAAIIVMADHGSILSNYYMSPLGALEYKLPLATVLLPKWWTARYPAAADSLTSNIRRLVTPYDLHETLRHLLTYPRPFERTPMAAFQNATSHTYSNNVHSRIFLDGEQLVSPTAKFFSLSLLSDTSPLNRTCGDAAIPAKWCACTEWQDATDEALVLDLLRTALKFLNRKVDKTAKFHLREGDGIENPCVTGVRAAAIVSASVAAPIEGAPPDYWSLGRLAFITAEPNSQLFVAEFSRAASKDFLRSPTHDVSLISKSLTLDQLYRVTAYSPKTGPESCNKFDWDPEYCICRQDA